MSSDLQYTPETIAEYDVVLSVSQDAINKQLRMLYDHKLDDTFVTVASQVEGGAHAVALKYTINHEWSIQVESYTNRRTKKVVLDLSQGIFAHIGCPRILLDGTDETTIEVEFVKDPSFAKSTKTLNDILGDCKIDVGTFSDPDSCLYYTDGLINDRYTAKENLNGWKLRWKVKLRVASIKGHISVLLNRHKDPNDRSYLPPGVKNSIKIPDSRLFTVSSMFCLVESTLFANSFEVVDADGRAQENKSVLVPMNDIMVYFKGHSAKGDPSMSSPDNLVLGYGLTQIIQKIQDIDRNVTWKDTPAYFVPATFDLTTTAASKSFEGKDMSGNNALSFCMAIHRSKGPGDK